MANPPDWFRAMTSDPAILYPELYADALERVKADPDRVARKLVVAFHDEQEAKKERDDLKAQAGVALSLLKNTEFNRDEYVKRCDEVSDLRRRLVETEHAGEDIRKKNAELLYQLNRARELREQSEARFNEVLAQREALRVQLAEYEGDDGSDPNA